MHPIFIAHGPAFKKAYKAEPFQSVDLYPLLCHLLDIKPRPNNGSLEAIKHILAGTDNFDITMVTCEFCDARLIKIAFRRKLPIPINEWNNLHNGLFGCGLVLI